MSSLLEKATELKENTKYGSEIWNKLKADHPELAKALLGTMDNKGGWKLHPATLCVYIDGDAIKFSINIRKNGLTAFGRLPDRVLDLDCVEAELKEGRVELRKK